MKLVLSACVAGLMMVASVGPAAAQPARVAAIGDSLTDEYAEQTYGNVAKSWTEILVQTGRIDMGPTAVQAGAGGVGVNYWGEPRRSGYRNNWARYAATSDLAVSFGEHFGAAGELMNHDADYLVIFLGANDYAAVNQSIYNDVYNGVWTEAQAFAWADSRVAVMRTILDTVQAPGAKIVLLSPPDFNFSGFIRNNHFDPSNRDRVTRMVQHARDGLRALAVQRRIVFLDMYRLIGDTFGTGQNQRARLLVGNVPIDIQNPGDTGAFGFVFDGAHPQRVVQSIWARSILTALNAGFNVGIPDLSESEMLTIGGLSYGGSDTLEQQIKPMRFYVQNFACPADYNVDGAVTVQDVFDFIIDYFGRDIKADLDGDTVITVGDVFAFLSSYFIGCR